MFSSHLLRPRTFFPKLCMHIPSVSEIHIFFSRNSIINIYISCFTMTHLGSKADGRPQHMFGRRYLHKTWCAFLYSETVTFMKVKGLNKNFTHLSYREVQSHIDNDKEK
jgi:hypothetical protein